MMIQEKRDKVAIFGAGGLGMEIGIELIGSAVNTVFLDDSLSAADRVYEIGSLLVGGKEKLESPPFLRQHDLIVALGDNEKRRTLSTLARSNGARMSIFIHSDASIGLKVQLDDGIIIMRGATVSNRVTIGKGTIINQGANVPHCCVLGEYVNICDGVVLGDVRIGDGTFVGLGATIKTGVMIGKNAFIGMGSVVVYDVPDGARVFGNPARQINERRANGQDHTDSQTTFPSVGGATVVPIKPGS
jgi:sugar O-acyltransferase (sialic acid O-acetyltransferase NeuD family)